MRGMDDYAEGQTLPPIRGVTTVDKAFGGGIMEQREAVFGDKHQIVDNVSDGGDSSGGSGIGRIDGMFELYDHVRIKKNNLIGTIVDISESDGEKTFIVESDVKGRRNDGYGGDYPLYWCNEDEISKVTNE